MQDVEAQMRRALGLFGAPRRTEQERPAAPAAPRPADRFGNGGHKRRFVQDGEVPVTVLGGRHAGAETHASRAEAAETALATERSQRERAERALAEANAAIHDLQTKLGHASLAHQELQAAAQRDQETIATLRSELRQLSERLSAAESARGSAEDRLAVAEEEFALEHDARLEAERTARVAEAARADAERLLQELDLNPDGPIDLPARRPGRPPRSGPVAKARSGVGGDAPEPEPVQWWLLPEKKLKRR